AAARSVQTRRRSGNDPHGHRLGRRRGCGLCAYAIDREVALWCEPDRSADFCLDPGFVGGSYAVGMLDSCTEGVEGRSDGGAEVRVNRLPKLDNETVLEQGEVS